ncbi:glycosyltransferase [Spirulina major]|uniref:glycosyltransferase n=1 Tax=Spirulina major TaxID=270636 RepID=UPI001FEB23C2|nr:glycosyltransferase [Spirulina major]
MKLSLCMIVKDEEQSLPHCLDSAKDVVDEIVILDTGSSDRTIAIAKDYGATVAEFPWNNDFAAARNEALKHVTGDWVLVLDADEELTEEAGPHIRTAMVDDSLLVVSLIREELGAVQSPYSLTSRLFRRHPKIEFSRPYHALIDDSVMALLAAEPQWNFATLQTVAIAHTGYTQASISKKDKKARAQKAMETYLADHPDDPYVCSKLGALYTTSGQHKPGRELLERGLKTPNLDPPVAYELHYHLANAYARRNNTDQAVIHYQAAISQNIFPLLKLGALINFGSLLHIAGEYEMAQRPLGAAIQIDPSCMLAYYNLGLVFKALGNYNDAIKAYEKAIELQADYAPAYQNLGVVWFKCGKIEEGLEYFGKAIAILDTQNLLEADKLRNQLHDMGFQAPKFSVQIES